MLRLISLTRTMTVCATLLVVPAVALTGCGSSQTGPGPVDPPPPQPPEPPPQPPQPPPTPTLGVMKILAFGDSMTEGVDEPPLPTASFLWSLSFDAGRSQSYPFKLRTLLTERYTAQTITVLNAGLAGQSARSDRGRFSDALDDGKPDLVLLMEGANDLNSPLGPTEGINSRIRKTVDALEEMIREANERRGIPIMVATLPPQRKNSRRGTGEDFIDSFNEELVERANKRGATVVDVASLPLSLIGEDGLHPTEAGYQRMAQIWFDAIKAKHEKATQ